MGRFYGGFLRWDELDEINRHFFEKIKKEREDGKKQKKRRRKKERKKKKKKMHGNEAVMPSLGERRRKMRPRTIFEKKSSPTAV